MTAFEPSLRDIVTELQALRKLLEPQKEVAEVVPASPETAKSDNDRVARRWGQIVRTKKLGHYETLYQICSEERERGRQEEAGRWQEAMLRGRLSQGDSWPNGVKVRS